jgi:hypothetical protein
MSAQTGTLARGSGHDGGRIRLRAVRQDAPALAGVRALFADRHDALADLRVRLLAAGGAVAWAHRAVLAAASPVVRAILTAPGFRESRRSDAGDAGGWDISLGGVSAETFDHLLDFAYRGATDVHGAEQLLLLYKAADQLDMQALRATCLAFVDASLASWGQAGHGTGIELMLMADALSLECVRSRCQGYMWQNLEAVATTTPAHVWRLVPPPVMVALMHGGERASPEHSSRCETWQDEAEVVFAAWADWCGGVWAELACVSLRRSRVGLPGLVARRATPIFAAENGGEDAVEVDGARVDVLQVPPRHLPTSSYSPGGMHWVH